MTDRIKAIRQIVEMYENANNTFKDEYKTHFKPKRSKDIPDMRDYVYDEPKTKEEKLVADFVKSLSDLEMREYNNYLDWLYHEMERQTD